MSVAIYLLPLIGVGLVVLIGLMSGLIKFPYQDNKIRPRLGLTWFSIHPDGSIGNPLSYVFNVNGKMVWDFPGNVRFAAEKGLDVLFQPGCEDGQAYFVFNCTQNGVKKEWKDANFAKYFSDARKIHSSFGDSRLQEISSSFIDKADLVDAESLESRKKASDYTANRDKVEFYKAMAMKGKGSGNTLNQIDVAQPTESKPAEGGASE